MKRFLLLTLAVIVTLVVIYFIPVTQTNDVVIKTNFDNVLSSLRSPGKWEKWHPVVKKFHGSEKEHIQQPLESLHNIYKFIDDKDSVVVKTKNPFLYDVQEYLPENFSSYAFEIMPSFNATKFTTIRVIEKTPLLFYLLPSLNTGEGEQGAVALKKYLENTKEFYGYDIKPEPVSDTVFATKMITISRNDVFKILPVEVEKIRSFIKDNHLSQTNFTSVSYIPKGDSLQLIVGIPVDRFAEGNNDVECVNIPKGRMLTGMYEGKFGDRKIIYDAMKKYTKDHSMVSVGTVIESYINDQLPVSDSSIVKFKLYYPIL